MLDLDLRRAILQLKARGLQVRAIARALRISRNTVRAVLAAGVAEVPRLEREETLGTHLDAIRALYVECAGNRIRVWEEFKKRQKVEVPYPTLTAFMRRHGIGVEVKQPAGRYHFEPGQEMQHDTSPHVVTIGGKPRSLQCASLVLCYSRVLYAQVYPRWTRFQVKVFLTEALQYLGAAADQCMLDNSSVIIAHGTGKHAVPAPEMAAFAARFDFKFVAHERGDANRSARVERPFWFIETNFYPGRTFADLADLNTQLRAWCERDARTFRKHLGARPIELLAAEKPALKPLPLYIPEVYDLHHRMVDVESFVCLHVNRYEVPWDLIGRQVEVRESKDRVRIFHGAREVAVHPRVEAGLEKRVVLPDGPERRRGRGPERNQPLREEVDLAALGTEVRELIGRLRARHGGRAVRHIRELHRLYLDYPTEPFRQAVGRALEYGLTDLGRIERILLALIAGEYFRLWRKDTDDDGEENGDNH